MGRPSGGLRGVATRKGLEWGRKSSCKMKIKGLKRESSKR